MSIHRLCEAAIHGTSFPRYGDGSQVREFTYVDDVVRGNLLAAERDVAPGSYCNLAGGGEVTLSQLIDLVGDLAGNPVRVEQQPRQAGDAFRNGGSIKRALELLDWAPEVSLRDGLRAQLEWHRSRA
jgi:nucleoside-diphosphate-sugar epimerase